MVRKVLMIHFSVFYTWEKEESQSGNANLFINEVYPLGETVN